MLVYYGGEDLVTKLIAKRLIIYAARLDGIHDLSLEDANPRYYGTRALEKLDQMIRLSTTAPVICVFDSDGTCVLELLKRHTKNGWKKKQLAINIAIDEGETWLMADRKGFAQYFGIKLCAIPDKKKNAIELSSSFPYKTSLYFLKELVPLSKKKKVLETLGCERPGKKPPTYNTLWPEFIERHWNIGEAIKNSDSLARAVDRIKAAIKD